MFAPVLKMVKSVILNPQELPYYSEQAQANHLAMFLEYLARERARQEAKGNKMPKKLVLPYQ